MTLRLSKEPLEIPSSVNVQLEHDKLTMSANQLSLSVPLHSSIKVEIVDGKAHLTDISKTTKSRAMMGTMARLMRGMIIGLTQGYTIELELIGIGYRAKMKGSNSLELSLLYSHEVVYNLPEGVSASVDGKNQTEIILKSHDKQLVGQVAANLIRLRPADAYKGKGVRKKGTVLKLKEVKKK